MKLYVGIDGGGTGTTLLCRGVDGGFVCRRKYGPFNITSIGAAQFRKLLREIMGDISNLGSCEAICIGSAGYSSMQLRDEVSTVMEESGIRKWELVSDSRIALEGALEGRDGIALIAGTGSVCIGKRQEQILSLGGWGHIIGDEGSGYALGRECFSHVALAIDGRAPDSLLVSLLKERLKLADRKELISYVYGGDKKRVAAAAPLVLEAAVRGDLPARKIVERNVQSLLDLISAVKNQLGFEETDLALLGGLLTNPTLMRRLLTDRISELYPEITIAQNGKEPAEGAIMLAAKASSLSLSQS